MSKIDAVYAALKDAVDFMVKQDVSDVAVFTQAASKCYQFFNMYPFYDVMDYLKHLRTYAFPGNTEFAGLVDKVGTAVKAAMAGHVDYSYSMDPTNGGSYNLTYSVTIGFNSKAMYLDKTYPRGSCRYPECHQGRHRYGSSERPLLLADSGRQR